MDGPRTQNDPRAVLAGVRRGLPRGERIIAPAGVVLASLLVATLIGAAWWGIATTRALVQSERSREVVLAATLLGDAAEQALARGDLAAARRSISEGSATIGLTRCRLSVHGLGVLADRDPLAVEVRTLDDRPWPPAAPAPDPGVRAEGGQVIVARTLEIPGRGTALIEVALPIEYPTWTGHESAAGFGVVGVLGLGGLWMTYRTLRRKLRGVCAVAEALKAWHAGEPAPEALRVDPAMGPEAQAWNAVIDEREAAQSRPAGSTAGAIDARPGPDSLDAGVLDALWQGVVVLDESGKVHQANGAACVLMGVPREKAAGADLASCFPDPAIKTALEHLGAGQLKQRVVAEVKRESRPGRVDAVIRVSIRPLRRAGGAFGLAVIEDVTQQREADSARNAFVAQASHELRTPLTNIRLYAESLLEADAADEAARQRAINVINQESRRLERIVGDMLSVSEIEAGAFRLREDDVRFQTVFEELEADFGVLAKDKDIALTFDLPPKMPVLHGDRDKLVLALHNVVGNALKYTPAGGKVAVKLDVKDPGTPAETVVVDVSDNGIGVKPDEAELIFEKFYRAKDGRVSGITGSGLGLALARQVVRLHGGDITLKSQPDKGSTFTISLPAAA
ncbi:MAG: PAS domain-containing protein [Phycisphaeraceae bacterium]|nr:MAG: PAS domain-containing protein [Phycisphaeraceae bacterium]